MEMHPVFGDSKYRLADKPLKLKKIILCCMPTKLISHYSDKKYNFSAELPLAFKNILKEKYLKIF